MDYNISVVIPVYNASRTIVSAIESVLYQSNKVFEIILIDDGSTDNSLDLINSVFKSYLQENFIKLISKKNEGPSIARNIGIDLARGNWIAFLDSDDYWHPNKIEKQIEFLRSYSDIKLCGTGAIDPEKTYQIVTFSDLLARNYFQTSSVIVSSVIMKDVKFNERQKYSEDYRAWLVINKTYKAAVINEMLTFQVIEKSFFGESGLSSKLWLMEKWELKNYIYLSTIKYIKFGQLLRYSLHSILKYLRRLLITTFKRSEKKI